MRVTRFIKDDENFDDDDLPNLGDVCLHSEWGAQWFRNGVRHRDDGPAVEMLNESQWYRDGKLHREGGPAIERADGSCEWWANGQFVRQEGEAQRRRVVGTLVRFAVNGQPLDEAA
jgi:hypothetical protein